MTEYCRVFYNQDINILKEFLGMLALGVEEEGYRVRGYWVCFHSAPLFINNHVEV